MVTYDVIVTRIAAMALRGIIARHRGCGVYSVAAAETLGEEIEQNSAYL